MMSPEQKKLVTVMGDSDKKNDKKRKNIVERIRTFEKPGYEPGVINRYTTTIFQCVELQGQFFTF